jgi:hypothetical protein
MLFQKRRDFVVVKKKMFISVIASVFTLAFAIKIFLIDICSVLPTGRNFGRKIQQKPHKFLNGRKNLRSNKSAANFFSDLSKKKPKRSRVFNLVLQIKAFLNFLMVYFDFLTHLKMRTFVED